MRLLLKLGVGVLLIAGFLFLFLRTARDVRSEPYVVERGALSPVTVNIEMAERPTSPLLIVRPPQAFGSSLFDQIFQRMMESLRGSTGSGIAVVLRDEYELALAARYTPDTLLQAARDAGLASEPLTPVCVGTRRISEPGVTRVVYFAILEAPAIRAFRHQLAKEIEGTPGAGVFDPDALSPVVIVGSSDDRFDSWLPLRVDPDSDCVAPITVN